MGQTLEAMNKPRPREELLYDLVSTGNIVAIKALCEEGVSLEVNLTMLLIVSTLKKKKKKLFRPSNLRTILDTLYVWDILAKLMGFHIIIGN